MLRDGDDQVFVEGDTRVEAWRRDGKLDFLIFADIEDWLSLEQAAELANVLTTAIRYSADSGGLDFDSEAISAAMS
jgi:hypothetical protein